MRKEVEGGKKECGRKEDKCRVCIMEENERRYKRRE